MKAFLWQNTIGSDLEFEDDALKISAKVIYALLVHYNDMSWAVFCKAPLEGRKHRSEPGMTTLITFLIGKHLFCFLFLSQC